MQKIGMIGGISWESTQLYCQILNKKVKEALGGIHEVKHLLASVALFKVIKQ